MSSDPEPPLTLLLNTPHFLFFIGKGGVGKTSLACACPLALTDRERRVLLVRTDLERTAGSVIKTPELLGISRKTLCEKIKKLQIGIGTASDAWQAAGAARQSRRMLRGDEPVLRSRQENGQRRKSEDAVRRRIGPPGRTRQ